jgi:zinc/manganese transport system substrate-binding protein
MLKLVRHSLLLGAAAFASAAQAQEPEKLDVIATFSILGDFARQVGGDRVEITTLVGSDGDAHAYEPRPADAAALANADVILVNGLYFEGFLERLVETSGTAAPVVELTKGVETIRVGEGGPSRGAEDAGHGQEEIHEHAAAAGHDHGAEETHGRRGESRPRGGGGAPAWRH